jgi:type IV pilus assembly protein PilX
MQRTDFKHHRSTRESGVVLIVVLMLVAIMSLVGVITMRNSTVTEQVSNNFRVSSVAQQAAELALRYCETVAVQDGSPFYAADRAKIRSTTVTGVITSGAWNVTTTWTNSANYISVTNGFSLSAETGAIRFKTAPQCVIEPVNNGAVRGYVVTARGFGNDAVLNATNGVTIGSEAWVQSILAN